MILLITLYYYLLFIILYYYLFIIIYYYLLLSIIYYYLLMLRISYCASDFDAIGSSIYCGAGCHFAVLGNL